MKQSDKDAALTTLSPILSLVKTEKMRSIYEGIAPAFDGAVHTFQNPAAVETGRLNHSSTWLFAPGSYNLATLPKKTALADPLYRVRDVIVPHAGRLLGAIDYRQAEAYWCAWIANDPVRMKMFLRGIDQYRLFVSVLKWDDDSRGDEVTGPERQAIGKVGVLSGQYRATWRTLLEKVNEDFDIHGVSIDAKTAKRMEALWPELWPRTPEWWKEVEDEVLTTGFTVNPFGRRRMYFGRRDKDSARAAVVREAIADGPQSANAMALNGALRRLYDTYDPDLLRILQNVHDEILFDFMPGDLNRVARVVKDELEQPFDVDGRRLVIPAEVNATSVSWGSMREVRI